MNKLLCCCSLALGCFLSVGSTAASSLSFSEIGDAGSLLGEAQNIGGKVSSIVGQTGGADRIDLFRFTWGNGPFQAATDGSFGSSASFDTMLFLFDGTGVFLAANDDFGGRQSVVSANLVRGDYLLAISGFPNGALNPAGDPFRFGATGTLTSWQGGGTFGSYVIGLSAPSAAVSEPASFALLGIALAGLGFSRHRKLH